MDGWMDGCTAEKQFKLSNGGKAACTLKEIRLEPRYINKARNQNGMMSGRFRG